MFTKSNVIFNNVENLDNIRLLEDGSFEFEINSEFITERETIEFEPTAPFAATTITNNTKKLQQQPLKPQDYFIGILIIILSIIYLFTDIYRVFYEYKERRKKLCTWQMP